MIIDCVSDLHGYLPSLRKSGGDVLIIAGDITAHNSLDEYYRVFDWIYDQNYKKKILVAGNHDIKLEEEEYKGPQGEMEGVFDYLCDSGVEFELEENLSDECTINGKKYSSRIKSRLKIWGSPWTKAFEGMNPRCKAFCLDSEEELAKKYELIPEDTDILVTHMPAHGIMDEIYEEGKHVGSVALELRIKKVMPRLHVFGHIHESHGLLERPIVHLDKRKMCAFANASLVDEEYKFVNKPIRIIL